MRRADLIDLLDSCQQILDIASERGSLSSEEHKQALLWLRHNKGRIDTQIPTDSDVMLLAVEIDEHYSRMLSTSDAAGSEMFNYDAYIQSVFFELNNSYPSIEQLKNIKNQLKSEYNPKVSLYHQCRNLCMSHSDDLLSGLLAL